MLVLGIDSTALTASVCIADITDQGIKTYSNFTLKNRRTHSENLLPMIDRVLDLYGAKPADLELIAVSAGPGSFTGVRIGVSTVKGMGMALGDKFPCVPVSTLEALAENLRHVAGIVCPLMDARRDQFYNALFIDGKRLCDDRLISAEKLTDYFENSDKDIVLCGDGMEYFLSLYNGEKTLTPASAVCTDQNALSVALCGYKKYRLGQWVKSEDLKPVYLRKSQAERELTEKQKKK